MVVLLSQQLTSSVFSVVLGQIVDHFGRRKAIIANSMFFICGAIILAASSSYLWMVGTFSFDRVFVSFRLQMVEAFLLLLLETRVEAHEICDSLAGFYSTAKQCLDPFS